MLKLDMLTQLQSNSETNIFEEFCLIGNYFGGDRWFFIGPISQQRLQQPRVVQLNQWSYYLIGPK